MGVARRPQPRGVDWPGLLPHPQPARAPPGRHRRGGAFRWSRPRLGAVDPCATEGNLRKRALPWHLVTVKKVMATEMTMP